MLPSTSVDGGDGTEVPDFRRGGADACREVWGVLGEWTGGGGGTGGGGPPPLRISRGGGAREGALPIRDGALLGSGSVVAALGAAAAPLGTRAPFTARGIVFGRSLFSLEPACAGTQVWLCDLVIWRVRLIWGRGRAFPAPPGPGGRRC